MRLQLCILTFFSVVFFSLCNSFPRTTLRTFLSDNCPLAHSLVLNSLADASIEIAKCLASASIDRTLGIATDLLPQQINGNRDEQKKLDVISNNICKQYLFQTNQIAFLASEEEDDFIGNGHGPVIVVIDPLDGSSNIDCASPTGTIFGMYDYIPTILSNGSTLNLNSLVGDNLYASGYFLYSSSTELVFTLGHNTCFGFTLCRDSNEYVLTRQNIRIPVRGSIYSLNDGRSSDWPQGLQQYIQNIKDGLGQSKTRYSSRYVCSLVADLHRTILYGGWAGKLYVPFYFADFVTRRSFY